MEQTEVKVMQRHNGLQFQEFSDLLVGIPSPCEISSVIYPILAATAFNRDSWFFLSDVLLTVDIITVRAG